MELKEHQPALNINEQIENLKCLNLVIDDEEYAKKFLNDVSYFRLIKAYSLEFKEKNSNYINCSFNDIVNLYLFNCELRQLLFPLIERIEINFRCRISNYFSKKYGVLGYENSDNFADKDKHAEFLTDVASEIKHNCKSAFVKNFQNNYEDGKIPMYALIELFTFGMLSKFYKNLNNADKKEIASSYGVGYTYLESWIESISYVRNICAHYGRLYNVNLSKTPILYKQYKEEGISSLRIFATLLCIKHLVCERLHWERFVERLTELIDKYPKTNLKLMGFPYNWDIYLLEK